jgi:PEP-CTERM motif
MNGIAFFRGTSYAISPLDVAILGDTGVSLVPEPGSLILLVSGGAAVAGTAWRRQRARRRAANLLDCV